MIMIQAHFIFTIIFFVYTHVSIAQDSTTLIAKSYEEPGAEKLLFVNTKKEARSLAQYDLRQGHLFFLLQSGEAAIVFDDDEEFEAQYGIQFFEYGCVGPQKDIAEAYAFIVFEYLDQLHGKKWQQEVRKDVLGLSSWQNRKN